MSQKKRRKKKRAHKVWTLCNDDHSGGSVPVKRFEVNDLLFPDFITRKNERTEEMAYN